MMAEIAGYENDWEEGPEEEWWEEEGEEYEDVSDREHGTQADGKTATEPGFVFQSAGESESADVGSLGSVVPLCVAGSKRPCGSDSKGRSGERCGSMYKKPCKHVKGLRPTHGGKWRNVGDAYCGIVGGAALVPGLDIFDSPVEVACGAYGTFRAIEILVDS
jgi:hypothetical protein